jgi:hypothetical protein
VVATPDATINAVTTANLAAGPAVSLLAGGDSKAISVTVTGNGGVAVTGAQIQFSSSDNTLGTISGTNPATTAASGVATTTITSRPLVGAYTVNAAFVSGQPMTVSIPITNIVTLVSSSTPTSLVGTSALGLDPQPVAVTAAGFGGTGISGVPVTLVVPTSGATGTVTTATGNTNGAGVANGAIAANGTVGAWTLKAQTTIGGQLISVDIPAVNTVQIASTSKPRPLANGGSDTITATVTGKNGYNPGSGVPVKFTISGSGCSGACGSFGGSSNTTVNTASTGVATATITSKSVALTAAQTYTVDAAAQVATGVTPNLASPVTVINTLAIGLNGTAPSTTTSPMAVTVSDGSGGGTNGFTVQFTIMNSNGINLGSTTADGYMCINTCPSPITVANEYLGMEMLTAGGGPNAGKAGVNINQPISKVSLDGNSYTAATGTTGVSLIATGTSLQTFIVRAKVTDIPGLPAAEAPFYDFALTIP